MKTQANTDFLELNPFHQTMCNLVFEHVWFPVEILCPNEEFKNQEQVDDYFSEHEDYYGVREINGKYQVNFPIYRLDYMVGLDDVLKHGILEDF